MFWKKKPKPKTFKFTVEFHKEVHTDPKDLASPTIGHKFYKIVDAVDFKDAERESVKYMKTYNRDKYTEGNLIYVGVCNQIPELEVV